MITTTHKKTKKATLSGFYKDVVEGLQMTPKQLNSKYFYDKEGDRLFQEIMNSPEYYPTRCEMEILQRHAAKIARALMKRGKPIELVELGAGDATKSIYLLQALMREKAMLSYYPIDISANVIRLLEDTLPEQVPGLPIKGICGEYFEGLQQIENNPDHIKVVMFLGSTIGNMTPAQATEFCKQLHERLQPGDLVLIGYDLKKNPQTVLDAYNDKQGITKDFNINLLKRINRELGGDFDTAKFVHYPTYDPISGACKSYLISTEKQQVHIGEFTIEFAKDEPIYMEISQKYSVEETDEMAAASGFKQVNYYFDSNKWFVDVLWQYV